MIVGREIRVGLLIFAGLLSLGAIVFLVSEKQGLFSLKNRYYVDFESVGGLSVGNPVQLNGVTVGSVKDVVLPQRIDEKLLIVTISVNRLYAERIREDSVARIKTIGLLGDKYIEITSGSPGTAQIEDGGRIVASPATDVDKLIAAGGDAAGNVVAISYSLRTILERMEEGEGILGQLTVESEQVSRGKRATIDLLESVAALAGRIERGEGSVGALLKDDDLADNLELVASRLAGILDKVESGDGAVTSLLNDPATRERVERTVENLDNATRQISLLAQEIRTGDGLLPRLLADAEYGEAVSRDLENLLRNLSLVSEKLADGDGTLGKLIEDPSAYEALNDILVGVDKSKMLRWLVRNRQKSGIEVRYEDAQEQPAEAADGTVEEAAGEAVGNESVVPLEDGAREKGDTGGSTE